MACRKGAGTGAGTGAGARLNVELECRGSRYPGSDNGFLQWIPALVETGGGNPSLPTNPETRGRRHRNLKSKTPLGRPRDGSQLPTPISTLDAGVDMAEHSRRSAALFPRDAAATGITVRLSGDVVARAGDGASSCPDVVDLARRLRRRGHRAVERLPTGRSLAAEYRMRRDMGPIDDRERRGTATGGSSP